MTAPATVYELLSLYMPPISIVKFLQATVEKHGATPEAAAWLERVVAARQDGPIPELDKFDSPYQAELVKGATQYE